MRTALQYIKSTSLLQTSSVNQPWIIVGVDDVSWSVGWDSNTKKLCRTCRTWTYYTWLDNVLLCQCAEGDQLDTLLQWSTMRRNQLQSAATTYTRIGIFPKYMKKVASDKYKLGGGEDEPSRSWGKPSTALPSKTLPPPSPPPPWLPCTWDRTS